jgi:hypothetical protein
LAGYISGTCICATNIHGGTITATNLSATNLTTSNFSSGYVSATCIHAGCIGGNCIFGSYIQGSCICGTNIIGGTLCGSTIRICASGTSVFTADSCGIYLGCTSCACAPFSVSPTGFLRATNACISGNLYATCIFTACLNNPNIYTGTICGTTLRIGGGEGSVFTADGVGIYLGSEFFNDAPFRVNLAGDLNATSATISGFLSACEVRIPNGDHWCNNCSFRFGGANGICWTGTGNVYIGNDVTIAGTVTAAAVSVGFDFWNSGGFKLGGDAGICYGGSGAIRLGSSVCICGDLTAKSLNIDTNNCWNSSGFTLGGTAGIRYTTSGNRIVLGSNTDVCGNICASTGLIGGWAISSNHIRANGMCLQSGGIISTTATPGDGNAGFSVCSNRLYLGVATNKYIDVSTEKIDLNFNTARVNLVSTGVEICGNTVGINSCTGTITLDAFTNLNMSAATPGDVTIKNSQNFIVEVNGNINFTTGVDTGEGFIVTAPNMKMGTDGNLCLLDTGTATDWVARSDYRLKNSIQPHRYGLCDVMKLNPVSYILKSDKCERNRIGFIAQCVREIIPEVVYGDDMLGIEYSKMVSVLTSAIQQQQCQIEELRNYICKLV